MRTTTRSTSNRASSEAAQPGKAGKGSAAVANEIKGTGRGNGERGRGDQ